MKNLRIRRKGKKNCAGGAIIFKPFFTRGCIISKRGWDGDTERVARKRAEIEPKPACSLAAWPV